MEKAIGIDQTAQMAGVEGEDPNTAGVRLEKGEVLPYKVTDNDGEYDLLGTDDPFPEDPNADPNAPQFTIRAVLVGCILGGVIAASK